MTKAEHQKLFRQRHPARAKELRQCSIKKRKAIVAALRNQPCADCGVQYPSYIMEFDHRNPTAKSFTLAGANRRSIEDIMLELSKCDVVCANCHRARTFTRETQ